MKTFINATIWITSLLLLLALGLPAVAAASQTRLHVSATVTPWLEFSAQQHVRFYQVDAADLERGFVDLPEAMTIRVRSNIGHPIAFRILGNDGRTIRVRESGAGLPGKNDNLLLVDATHAQQALSKSLDVRVMLPENAETGRYPLTTTLIPEAY